MMRNLIIALLAMNVFYFVWILMVGSSGYKPPPKLLKGITGIELLPNKSSSVYQSNNTVGQSSCYTFGPLNNEKTARLIASYIYKFGLAAKVHKKKTMQTLNFLVYLQAQSSRKEAEKIILDLSKQDVTEYKIIDSGPYKNAIAFGSFDNLNKARRHSEYIRFLGYDARYTTQKVPKEVFWIDYDEPFGSNVPVIRWTKEIDARTSAQKIPKACARV